MRPDEARRLSRATAEINGWFPSEAAMLFALLDQVQQENAVEGDLFEIGVHHGKSAIHLGAMATPSERLRVCDVFGGQAANVSGSGAGDRDVFLRNFRTALPDAALPEIFEQPSSTLTPRDVSRCRFFHVDGGHSLAETAGDLDLGASALLERGTLVLDDAFNPVWPSVTEALLRFLARERQRFVPLVIGFKKAVVVRREARPLYDAYLSSAPDAACWRYISSDEFALEVKELSGSQVLVFSSPGWKTRPRIGTRVRRLVRRLPSSRSRLRVR